MNSYLRVFFYLFLFSMPFLFYCSTETNNTNISETGSWQFSNPEDQGLDYFLLEKAFLEAEKRDFINSMLIIKNGYIVAERYYNGYKLNSPHNIYSVSKSFLSALTGIALREGYISDLDVKILDYFPEYDSPDLDSRIKDITVRDLLTMKAGINSDRDIFVQIFNSSNWIQNTLKQPLIFDPGSRYKYTTAGTHLLSGFLSKVIDMDLREFADLYLFGPMQISIAYWPQDQQGNYFGGSNMYFTTRNMARLGLLYLNNGRINGRQIIPEEWVSSCIQSSTSGTNSWGDLDNLSYGYLWWRGDINGYEIYTGLGHGGQFVLVIKELNMIIATNSFGQLDWDPADEQERSVLELMANYVLPAVK